MPLMAGKQGLIMGVANERSLAWGIAKALHGQGAELAFTYQGEALGKRVRPLAESTGSDFVVECDVADEREPRREFSRPSASAGAGSISRFTRSAAPTRTRSRENMSIRRVKILRARSIFPAFRSLISAGARRR